MADLMGFMILKWFTISEDELGWLSFLQRKLANSSPGWDFIVLEILTCFLHEKTQSLANFNTWVHFGCCEFFNMFTNDWVRNCIAIWVNFLFDCLFCLQSCSWCACPLQSVEVVWMPVLNVLLITFEREGIVWSFILFWTLEQLPIVLKQPFLLFIDCCIVEDCLSPSKFLSVPFEKVPCWKKRDCSVTNHNSCWKKCCLITWEWSF